MFQESIRTVWKDDIVTIQSVNASRIVLDILNICPNFDGQKTLREKGMRVEQLCGIERGGRLRTALGWHPEDEEKLLLLHHFVQNQMVDPILVAFKTSHRRELKAKAKRQRGKPGTLLLVEPM